MIKIFLTITLLLLSNCAISQKAGLETKPEVTEMKLQKEFDSIPAPAQKKLLWLCIVSKIKLVKEETLLM
jgi:hypothetical protein